MRYYRRVGMKFVPTTGPEWDFTVTHPISDNASEWIEGCGPWATNYFGALWWDSTLRSIEELAVALDALGDWEFVNRTDRTTVANAVGIPHATF